MNFPTLQEWRAQVDKELGGASFEKTLVYRTPEGISVAPLYTELPPGGAATLDRTGAPFRICMQEGVGTGVAQVDADIAGGADAVWLRGSDTTTEPLLARVDLARTFLVLDTDGASPVEALERLARRGATGATSFALACDPFAALATGATTDARPYLTGLAEASRSAADRFPLATTVVASSLPYHDAGADDADEIAIVLSTGVAYLETLLGAGLSVDVAARQIALQIAVGRDTFGEACKLRALRVVWEKVLVAAGATDAHRTLVHAVCSSRTLAQRDPWVNMLRVSTQVFAAVVGGADVVTPAAFDQALGSPSELARRVARNTALVLRDESHLGRVVDPAAGSYYFEALTDALAREAWKRFQAIERDGGIGTGLTSGHLRASLEAAWQARVEAIAKRKLPILGVSEFANLKESLPHPATATEPRANSTGLPVHRDSEAFERLRSRADAVEPPPEALLVTLGPLAESRPRVGFATGFFGAGGIASRETTADEAATLACICGSDERYAAEAVERARTLKAAGCKRVLVAGRPGALEAALRDAGVDGFLFVGCDAVAMLSDLLGEFQ
jgi:methylmalonyl-CoA mutase